MSELHQHVSLDSLQHALERAFGGRLGGILGPVIGGMLLGIGLPPRDVLLFASGPALVTAALVIWLGFVSRGALARSSTPARSLD